MKPKKMSPREWNKFAKNNPWVIAEPVIEDPEKVENIRAAINELEEATNQQFVVN